jgi:hypothetical protein
MLGYCYYKGHGANQDLAQAVEWLRKEGGIISGGGREQQ